MRPILLGLCAAFFFAFTFILNRAMDLEGGSWIWSASLRFFFMVPFLLIIVTARRNLGPVIKEMKKQPGQWMLWSFVGFGLFYAPLCLAAAYAPGWLIAGTWQFTIIAGSLLSPFFTETIMTKNGPIQARGKIPLKGLAMSFIILLGIALMFVEQSSHLTTRELIFGAVPMIIAAFAYPLGNRKMMQITGGRLDAYQRVLGMTHASLPLWIILSAYGFVTIGPPSSSQTIQTLLVALFSGVIATVLFFQATDLVSGNMQKLAAVEATQSLEVLFAAVGEIILLSSPLPSPVAWCGMVIIMIGMVSHSYLSNKTRPPAVDKGVSA